MLGKKLAGIVAVALFATFGLVREGMAATITVGSGWLDGTAGGSTDLISFDFTLASAGVFSLTDILVPGDIWTITGDVAGASTLGLSAITVPLGIGSFAATMDAGWTGLDFTHFQTMLAAGTYSLFVSGDGGGGFPASFGVRVDVAPVPLPAGILLLASALAGLGLMSRRRGRRLA